MVVVMFSSINIIVMLYFGSVLDKSCSSAISFLISIMSNWIWFDNASSCSSLRLYTSSSCLDIISSSCDIISITFLFWMYMVRELLQFWFILICNKPELLIAFLEHAYLQFCDLLFSLLKHFAITSLTSSMNIALGHQFFVTPIRICAITVYILGKA